MRSPAPTAIARCTPPLGHHEGMFDLTPGGIIRTLKLRRPIYLKTAAYGHFGRDDGEFPWEELDRVKEIKQAAKHH